MSLRMRKIPARFVFFLFFFSFYSLVDLSFCYQNYTKSYGLFFQNFVSAGSRDKKTSNSFGDNLDQEIPDLDQGIFVIR